MQSFRFVENLRAVKGFWLLVAQISLMYRATNDTSNGRRVVISRMNNID